MTAEMGWDTVVAEAADDDSVMELVKDNGHVVAAGYIEARNTPFDKTLRTA